MMTNPLAQDLDHVLKHTHDLWDELRGKSIFITGGTGFFGCWLLESLLWANDQLNLNCLATILSRSPERFRAKAPHLAGHKAVSILRGDVRTFEFPSGEFNHIIHAATESSTALNAENPLQMLDAIVEGTRHTLDFAKACGAENFLLTSSGAVYGKQPAEITHIPEEFNGAPDTLNPRSAYGEGKRVAEHLCTLYADKHLKPKIARCFAFVGPYLPLDIHFAIGNFIRDALHGGPIIIQGDGTPYRSYLYAADLAIWLWTILLRSESLRPYNVGSEDDHPISDIAKHVAERFQRPIKIEIRTSPDPHKPVTRYVPQTRIAQTSLSLAQTISLDSAISRTIQWHQQQGS